MKFWSATVVAAAALVTTSSAFQSTTVVTTQNNGHRQGSNRLFADPKEMTEYMVKAHEEKLRAVQQAEAKKNAEIEVRAYVPVHESKHRCVVWLFSLDFASKRVSDILKLRRHDPRTTVPVPEMNNPLHCSWFWNKTSHDLFQLLVAGDLRSWHVLYRWKVASSIISLCLFSFFDRLG